MSPLFTMGFLEIGICFYMMSINVCIYVCSLLLFSSCRGQTKEVDSLELELETIVKCHLCAGNQIRVLC